MLHRSSRTAAQIARELSLSSIAGKRSQLYFQAFTAERMIRLCCPLYILTYCSQCRGLLLW